MNDAPRWMQRLLALDRRWHHAPRRLLGAALILLFLGILFAMLYLWFRIMEPYPT